jgi:uncharacterized protein YPO0396
MSDLTKDLKQELDALYTLRDEIRVHLHLFNQEAKEKWDNLERELERVHDNAARVTKHSLTDLGRVLREFKNHIEASVR